MGVTQTRAAGAILQLGTTVLLFAAVVAGQAAESPSLEHARALLVAKRLPEAQAVFEQLARLEPAHAEVHFHLGELALQRDDAEMAIACLERAAALEPESAQWQQRLGDAFGHAAQKAGVFSQLALARKSLASYERAVELEPGNVGYRQSLFGYYQNAPRIAGGSTERARAEATVIKQLDPAAGRIAFAAHYVAEGKFALAIAQFDEPLRSNPDDYHSLYQVGRLAALTGHYAERGLAALRRCLELPVPATPGTPDHAAAQWRLGTLLQRMGDIPGARTAFEAALQLNPQSAAAADSLRKLR